MIVVRLIGGIGNQLFQYYFGKFIERMFHLPVMYDVMAFSTVNTDRSFELKLLFTDMEIYTGDKFEFSKYRKFRKLFRLVMYKLNIYNHYITERPICNIKTLKPNHTYYFDGYWQDPVIIAHMFPILKEKMFPKEIMPKELHSSFINIKNCISVCIHVRRGDYFDQKNINKYGKCNEHYYPKAIERVQALFGISVKFFVFSEDLKWVKEHLNLPENSVYIPNINTNSYWYIFLMSHCNINIISNSTFSWWGAYLNSSLNKIVIAPKKWVCDSDKTIALSDWIKI